MRALARLARAKAAASAVDTTTEAATATRCSTGAASATHRATSTTVTAPSATADATIRISAHHPIRRLNGRSRVAGCRRWCRGWSAGVRLEGSVNDGEAVERPPSRCRSRCLERSGDLLAYGFTRARWKGRSIELWSHDVERDTVSVGDTMRALREVAVGEHHRLLCADAVAGVLEQDGVGLVDLRTAAPLRIGNVEHPDALVPQLPPEVNLVLELRVARAHGARDVLGQHALERDAKHLGDVTPAKLFVLGTSSADPPGSAKLTTGSATPKRRALGPLFCRLLPSPSGSHWSLEGAGARDGRRLARPPCRVEFWTRQRRRTQLTTSSSPRPG